MGGGGGSDGLAAVGVISDADIGGGLVPKGNAWGGEIGGDDARARHGHRFPTRDPTGIGGKSGNRHWLVIGVGGG